MRKIHLSLLLAVALLSACSANEANTGAVNNDVPQLEDGNANTPAVNPNQDQEAETETAAEHTPANKLDQFIADGFKVEAGHVFKHAFEGIGELTVTPVTKLGITELFPISLILTGEGQEIVLTPDREPAHPLFSSFEAISFKDIDDSGASAGFTDIIVIANFITGAGQDGAKPFSDLFIFKNDGKGGFAEDTELENSIIEAAGSRTLTVKQVLDLTQADHTSSDLDVSKLLGTYQLVEKNEYRFSEIIIEQIKDNRVIFDLDAYVVRGGKEGLENGNVNIGNLADAEAILDGNIAVYQYEEGYTMTFNFDADGTFTITEEGTATPFGYGVTVSGKYGKV